MILKNNNYKKKLLNSKFKYYIVFENVDVSVHKKDVTQYLVRISDHSLCSLVPTNAHYLHVPVPVH